MVIPVCGFWQEFMEKWPFSRDFFFLNMASNFFLFTLYSFPNTFDFCLLPSNPFIVWTEFLTGAGNIFLRTKKENPRLNGHISETQKTYCDWPSWWNNRHAQRKRQPGDKNWGNTSLGTDYTSTMFGPYHFPDTGEQSSANKNQRYLERNIG